MKDILYDAPVSHGVRDSHTLAVLVENKPGVLARVAGMFARRSFNIHSLAVGPTEDPAVSRMTIVVKVEEKPLHHIIGQLEKLVNVLHIDEITPEEGVRRELMLVKVGAAPESRSEIIEIADIFRAKIVDVGPDCLILEATGTPDKQEALLRMLEPHGILETAKTGLIALERGGHTIHEAFASLNGHHQ